MNNLPSIKNKILILFSTIFLLSILAITILFTLAAIFLKNIGFVIGGISTVIILILIFIAISLYIYYLLNPLDKINKLLIELNEGVYNKILNHSDYKEYEKLYNAIFNLSLTIEKTNDILNKKDLTLKDIDMQKENEQKQQRDLVYSVSHELKTPIAIIEASTQAILDGIYKGNEVNNQLNLILKECESSTKMLTDILNVYKMKNRNFKLNLKEIDLKDLVNDKVLELKEYQLKYQMNLNLDLVSSKIKADKDEISKVLTNVFMNAYTYSPSNSSIYANIKDLGDETIFELINENVTIDENKLLHIFEPFTKLDESHTKKQDHGTGLGLYIVKEILDKHNALYGMVNLDNAVKFYMIFKK